MFEIVTYCRLFFVVDDDDHDYEPGVGFKKLDYVWMFEHVTYRGLPLQVVQGEAGGRGELGHVHHLRQGHEAGVGEYKSQGKSESASGVWGIVQTSLAIIWAVGLIEICPQTIKFKSARFHAPKNGTSGAETKKRRPLFNANYPPKWCRASLFYAFSTFGWVLSQFWKIMFL